MQAIVVAQSHVIEVRSMDMVDAVVETLGGGEDAGPFGGVLVVSVDEGADSGFELLGRGMDALRGCLLRRFGESAFDLVV